MMNKLSFHHKVLISLCLAFGVGLWANFSLDESTQPPVWIGWLIQTCEFIGKLFLKWIKNGGNPLGLNLRNLWSFTDLR